MTETFTITKTDVQVEVHTRTEEEGQTILHCRLKTDGLIRIWKSTFLVADNGHKYKLIHAEDIAVFPYWHLPVMRNGFVYFTLFFERLGNDVGSFYMEEQIPEPGGFMTDSLQKNASGVYRAEVFCK